MVEEGIVVIVGAEEGGWGERRLPGAARGG